MIVKRPSNERGHANFGWLDSYHTFSFANYYDPQHMSFRSLRVINEDRVAGGGGFDTHPHRDMEIVTYVLSGALQHRDSLGNSEVIKAGDVQRMTAGAGIQHSEFNYSPIEPVHLLQIWLLPEKKGLRPGYEQKSILGVQPGTWSTVAAKEPGEGTLKIHQDVTLSAGKLTPDKSLSYTLATGRHAWVQVVEGPVTLNGVTLESGDGAAVSDEQQLSFSTSDKGHLLLFDLA
ncbi:MAG TPA: pirin family protein [Verrucomicrobiae bacterium]